MRVFFDKSSLAAFIIAGIATASMPSFAQSSTEPLDLTILSTNEENVQFIVIDETKPTPLNADNQSQNDKGSAPDNNSLNDAGGELAQDNVSDDVSLSPEDETPPATDKTEETAERVAEEVQATEEEAPKATRIQRRAIKDVGLASIGIDEAVEGLDGFDSLLWRGLSVEKALAMIKAVPVSQNSVSLRATSYQVIARQAVPPKGAADDPMMLLDARMGYLARAGRSDGLAAIIRQLPDNEDWQSWKEWQIFYDLMMREDEAACKQAAEKVKTSLDPLWQKTNLLCQILTGNEAMAAFSSDVLKASGLVEDDLFFALIDVLLGRRDGSELTSNEPVSLMNLILMDAAHITISAPQIAALDQSYAKAANALRYMSDEARQIHGLTNLKSGLLSSADAKALFLSSIGNVDDPLKAMTRRIEEASDLSSVQLYLSLQRAVAEQAQSFNDQTAADNATAAQADDAPLSELPHLIAQAVGFEMRAQDGLLWSSFYAPIMAEAMTLADMSALSAELQTQYAILAAFSGRGLSPLPVDGQAVIMADHIALILDNSAPLAERQDALFALGLDDLLALLDDAGDTDWFSLYLESDAKTLASYQALPQTGLKALAQAAATGQQAEVVLLATILIGQHDLAQIAPSDLAMIIKALSKAELNRTASALSAEAIRAHSFARMVAYF